MNGTDGSSLVFVVTAGSQLCGLSPASVVEVLRPLPVEPWPEAPAFVMGLTRLRGAAVPVVNLESCLGGLGNETVSRFVHLRIGGRAVALAVQAVEGLRRMDPATLGALPPLLGDGGQVVESLAALDRSLLLMLRLSHLLPPEAGSPGSV